MVSTPDFESGNPSSNLGRTSSKISSNLETRLILRKCSNRTNEFPFRQLGLMMPELSKFIYKSTFLVSS